MVGWGAMALFQCAAKNFAGMLVIRLLLGAFEGTIEMHLTGEWN